MKAIDRTIAAIQAWKAAKRAAEAVLAAARAAEAAALNAKKLAIERAKKTAQAAKKKAADKVNTTSNKASNATKKTGNPVQKQAQAKSNPKSSSAASSGAGSKSGGVGKESKPGGSSGGSARSNGGSSGSGGAGRADGDGGSCNSFVPGTRVLMADGSAKPIEDVKPGDQVIVTDPETGRTEAETVTAEITGNGAKHLVKVVIDTDGEQGSETAEVIATDGHPFWVPELGEWIDATDLQSGQWLRTSAGTWVQIAAVERWSVPHATVHNLTVANTHTYYVVTSDTSLLVHNCNTEGPVDHVALGRRDHDLKGFAESVEARHLLGATDATWRDQVLGAIARTGRGEGRISFMLDGLPGDTQGPAKALKIARDTAPAQRLHTQWELIQIDEAGLMGKVDFYRWNRRVEGWAKVKFK